MPQRKPHTKAQYDERTRIADAAAQKHTRSTVCAMGQPNIHGSNHAMSRMLHGIRAIIYNSASEQWRRRTPRVSPFVNLRDSGWLAWSALQRALLLKATLQRASLTRTLVLDWCDCFRDMMRTLLSRQNAADATAAATPRRGHCSHDMVRWIWYDKPVTASTTERGRRNTIAQPQLPRHGWCDSHGTTGPSTASTAERSRRSSLSLSRS